MSPEPNEISQSLKAEVANSQPQATSGGTHVLLRSHSVARWLFCRVFVFHLEGIARFTNQEMAHRSQVSRRVWKEQETRPLWVTGLQGSGWQEPRGPWPLPARTHHLQVTRVPHPPSSALSWLRVTHRRLVRPRLPRTAESRAKSHVSTSLSKGKMTKERVFHRHRRKWAKAYSM